MRVLDAVEARFRAKLAPLQAEVATLAEAECAATLTRRGYVLQAFENVLGCEIGDDDRAVPAGVVVGRMADGMGRQWLDVAVTGFMHPDTQGVVPEPLPPREVLEGALEAFADVPGFLYYLATIDGEIAGVATMRLDGEVAQLCGATTLPAFRRRGVQTALLADSARRRAPRRSPAGRHDHRARLEVAGKRTASGIRPAVQPRAAREGTGVTPAAAPTDEAGPSGDRGASRRTSPALRRRLRVVQWRRALRDRTRSTWRISFRGAAGTVGSGVSPTIRQERHRPRHRLCRRRVSLAGAGHPGTIARGDLHSGEPAASVAVVGGSTRPANLDPGSALQRRGAEPLSLVRSLRHLPVAPSPKWRSAFSTNGVGRFREIPPDPNFSTRRRVAARRGSWARRCLRAPCLPSRARSTRGIRRSSESSQSADSRDPACTTRRRRSTSWPAR